VSEETRGGLTRLFQAASVAVVGASTSPGKLGHEILTNLVHGGCRLGSRGGPLWAC